MSVSKWRWTESCDGKPCCGECDLCTEGDEEDDGDDGCCDVHKSEADDVQAL